MPGSVAYLEHRPVWVVWGAPTGSPVLLGFSESGATIDFADEIIEHTADQTGALILEGYHKPGPVTVTVTLSQMSDIDVLDIVFPFGEKQIDTSTPPEERFVGDKTTVGLTTPYAGTKVSTIADVLRLVPADEYVSPSTETTNQFVIPTAYPANWGQWALSLEQALAPEMVFKSLYDPTTAQLGTNHWHVGKITAASGAFSAV